MGNSSSDLHKPGNNLVDSIDYSEMSNKKSKKLGRLIRNKSRKIKKGGLNSMKGGTRRYKSRRSSRRKRNKHSKRCKS